MYENIQWETPSPLRGNKCGMSEFPVNAMPSILREMTKAISVTTSTDPAMAGTAILSAVSYCFSGIYRMSGKRDHTEPLVLDALTVADPSAKKSPVIALVKAPYIKFAGEWNELHKNEIFRLQAEKKLIESRISELEKKEDASAQEIADLKTKLSDMPSSDFRRIVVDDITPESLVSQLEHNGTLLMMSDEAGSLGNFTGRYSNNIPNLDLLLKSWNGETFISDRATRGSITLKRPYLSICLACQPYVFDAMMNNTAFRGSGLMARLVYCFPKSNIGHRRYDTQPVPEEVSESYRKLIYLLLNGKFRYSSEEEQCLEFDETTFQEFVDFYNGHIEKQLITDMAFCRDWGGKYHGLLLRLCGVIHCVKCRLKGENPAEVPVGLETFCNSVELAEYYREQAIYAYSLGEVDTATIKAERVVDKIRSRRIGSIRQNELYKLCRCSLFRNAQDFSETLDMLEEYGYLCRIESRGANNKTVTDIAVNPGVYSL